jgi:hypothetical protein
MAVKRHVMTARRKAALRKAQLASAHKRKKRGRQIKRGKAKAWRKRARAAYPVKNNPGRLYRMNSDRRNSRGVYSKHPTGRNLTKGEKRGNKIGGTYLMAAGINPLMMAGSYARGRRAGTIKKRKR